MRFEQLSNGLKRLKEKKSAEAIWAIPKILDLPYFTFR